MVSRIHCMESLTNEFCLAQQEIKYWLKSFVNINNGESIVKFAFKNYNNTVVMEYYTNIKSK